MAQAAACACGKAEVSFREMTRKVDTVLTQYRGKPGALIPVLQTAQGMFGYLPEPLLRHIALAMDKPYSEVAGVVGFYSFFSTTPRGKYIIRVCLGTACYVRGGQEVLAALKKALGIDVGQTTDDRLFTLEVGRCFGACGLAPAVMVNDDVHQRVKAARIRELIAHYVRREKTAGKKGART